MANFNYYWNGLVPMSQQSSQQPAYSQAAAPASTVTEPINMDLKVLSPANKKEFRMFVLSAEIDSPWKLRDEILRQYGEKIELDPDMKIGYFHYSWKIWITSKLDVVDMWGLISNGERVTFWCIGKEPPANTSKKRPPRRNEKENEPPPKKMSKVELETEKVKDYETELKTKHENSYSPFQYKATPSQLLVSGPPPTC